MDRIDTMQLFVRIVETRSFARAADEHGLSRASTTERIAALEQHLGVRLLNRTRRKISPTSEGAEFLKTCRLVLREVSAIEATLGNRAERPSGRLRVSANVAVGRCLILPHLPPFLAAHPELELELILNDARSDFVTDGIDVAIRIGGLEDQDLVMRQLGRVKRVIVASPGYLARHGTPSSPADIEHHRSIDFILPVGIRRLEWEFEFGQEITERRFASYVALNDGVSCVEAAIADLGIVQTLSFVAKPHLDAGRLVRLLPEYETFAPPISALFAPTRHVPARIRTFIAFAAELTSNVRDDQ
jgi:LysR family transcriptional regulator for bpeEF and oprC